MKEHIKLIPKNSDYLILPLQYNHIIQGMIYNLMNEEIASFLHEKGFIYEKRSFKMFTFSRLIGNYTLNKKDGKIIFQGPVLLTISSPFDEFCNSIASSLLLKKVINLGNSDVEIEQVTFEKDIVKDNKIKICSLSPIVLYSTLFRPDGRKYTCYFQPGENEYDKLLENNLKKKYMAFYKQEITDGEVKIACLNQPRLSIINYKNTIIKGYTGTFILSGPIPLLQIAVDSGLGSKNSQGFGCVKILA
jgi:CRISPR-associated endoribonuclease Cas6